MLWLGFVLPISIYALVVIFSPLDVIDKFPALGRWADWVHGLLLTSAGNVDIYRHARSTTFPQVAMLTSAMGVSAAWFIALAGIINSTFNYHHIANVGGAANQTSAKDKFGAVFVFPLFGIFCMWAFYCLKGDPSFAAGFTTQGRIGYLFISTIAISSFGIGIGMWPYSVRALFDKKH